MLRCIESFDPEAVIRAEEEGKGFACGRGALAAVLWAAKDMGADLVKVLNHATSGDVTGDTSQVVGYGAAVVLRKSYRASIKTMSNVLTTILDVWTTAKACLSMFTWNFLLILLLIGCECFFCQRGIRSSSITQGTH